MIYLRKNGIFYENNMREGHKDYVMEEVESIIPYLNEVISIDDDITLEDFFNIVEKDEEIINIIFGSHLGHFPVGAYIEEIKKDCPLESKEDMYYIELVWVAEQFDYREFYEKYKNDKRDKDEESIFGPLEEPDKDCVNEISIYISVHGVGKYELAEGETYENEEDVPPDMGYAIEFTPLYRLKHLPIRLNKNFVMRDKNEVGDKPGVVEGEKEFSVFDVFGEILLEISFAGLPEDRDEQWKDVINTVDEYKTREEDDE